MTSLLDIIQQESEENFEDGMPEFFIHSPYYSNEEAIQVLCNNKNVFKLLSLNCQSLCAKFDQLQIYLNYYSNNKCPFPVICLQETWLSADHDITQLQLEGYKFIYKPKLSSLHGGVAFYVKESMDIKVLPVVVNDELCDSLFIEIDLNNCVQSKGKVVLGNIYRPPRENVNNYNNFIECLEETISVFQNTTQVALVGDFNFDLLKIHQKDHINNFFETLLSCGFFPKITLPTRITEQTKTLIDNCFVKSLNSLSETTSGILYQNISDHQPYFVSFDCLLLEKHKCKYIQQHKQTQTDLENFRNQISIECSIEQFSQEPFESPNHNYETLDDILKSDINKHLPSKLVKYNKHKHKKEKWITKGIMHSIHFRDKLYKRLRNTPATNRLHETLKINLRTYNRILKKLIREAKKQYYQSCFDKYKNDIKKTWDTITYR
jgi:exonuclease III